MIRIQGLTYFYPRAETPALENIDLDIPTGQFLGVVGASGSGKSTLSYAITGFVPHFYRGKLSGQVEAAGINVPKSSLAELTQQIGLVFQNPFNQITGARYTVREEAAFGLENLGVPRDEISERVDKVLIQTNLSDLADRSPFTLSGGQQQRMAIASIVVMRPKVLVLDEPTSQLDPAGTRETFETLQKLTSEGNTTVILVSHKLEWMASFADRVIALANGKLIADDSAQAVLSDERLRRAGIGMTRYTQAARLAVEHGLIKKNRVVPVTHPEAVGYFNAD